MTESEHLSTAFSAAVPVSFGFLISEYGFSLTQERDWLFRAQSPYCRIAIYLDRTQLVTAFERVVDGSQEESKRHYIGEMIDIAVIALCLDPQAHVVLSRNLKPEEVRDEVNRQSELLRHYCSPFLRGDFSSWEKLVTCLEERGKSYQLKEQKESKEYRLSDIRSKAESAWYRKDYEQVASLYESIQDDLTSLELRRLEYARKQL